jgi:hypothetical protein
LGKNGVASYSTASAPVAVPGTDGSAVAQV